jgi:hypothetical protein
MKKFKIENTELPVLWLGTSLFAGAGEFGDKAQEYYSQFYDNPELMVEVMARAAELGWGIEALAMSNIVKSIDKLKKDHPKAPVAYTCGIEDFVTEVNSALKRAPQLIFLHPRVTDTATDREIELYFRRVTEEWVLPAAATLEPLKMAARLEDTECRALLVTTQEKGAALEHAVATVHEYGLKYLAEIQPVGNVRDIVTSVHSAVRAGVDALIIGVTTIDELKVYMRALERMGFLN